MSHVRRRDRAFGTSMNYEDDYNFAHQITTDVFWGLTSANDNKFVSERRPYNDKIWAVAKRIVLRTVHRSHLLNLISLVFSVHPTFKILTFPQAIVIGRSLQRSEFDMKANVVFWTFALPLFHNLNDLMKLLNSLSKA